jgi:hypothetical protein
MDAVNIEAANMKKVCQEREYKNRYKVCVCIAVFIETILNYTRNLS